MTAHETSPRTPARAEVERALGSIDFPLDKEQLVACVAEDAGDDRSREAVLRQLRALPLATYGSVDEVLRSVDVADQRGR